jgi:hypothetical protein
MSHDFLRRSHEIGASRARRKVLKKRSLKAAAAALGGTKLTSDRARGKGRPRENRAVQEKRPRGMGMGKK